MPNRLYHRVAIALLFMLAIWNMASYIGTHSTFARPAAALVFWAVLIWGITTRPRRWGLWVGIGLIAMIAFQVYLWRLALKNPGIPLELREAATFWHMLPYWSLIFLAAIFCLLLRFCREASRPSRR